VPQIRIPVVSHKRVHGHPVATFLHANNTTAGLYECNAPGDIPNVGLSRFAAVVCCESLGTPNFSCVS
jgi:hypothetical protein